MDYRVNLEVFQGPLDLLLHLIEKQELNIYDIPISDITEQYLSYIKNIEELNLDNACDFLVMAATLLSIKAKMLLPKPKKSDDNNAEDEEDPRDVLVQHLLNYKKVKEAAGFLKELEKEQRKKLTRPIDKEQFICHLFPDTPVVGLGIKELMQALEKLMKDESNNIHLIQKKEYFIEDQMKLILSKTHKANRIIFKDLFINKPSILEIIVTFLALLELVKQRKILVIQEEIFGQITILKGW